MRSNHHSTDLQPGSDFDGASVEQQDDLAIGRLSLSEELSSILELWLAINTFVGVMKRQGS